MFAVAVIAAALLHRRIRRINGTYMGEVGVNFNGHDRKCCNSAPKRIEG